MITFIICVKHYKNCHSYDATWKILKNTLVSVCNQTDKNFDVIVVSNKTLNNFSNNPKIKNVKFIEVDWTPPASSDAWQMKTQTSKEIGLNQARTDKGSKYILALSQIQKVNNENHYVMFVDADDFIHKKLAEYVNNSDKDFLKVSNGYMLASKNSFKKPKAFNLHCGTCNIIKVELLKEEINFEGITLNSSQQYVIQSTKDYYLKMIIGSHKWTFNYFIEKGYVGGEIPFFSAIYNCTHNEQHSGKSDLIYNNKCSDEMIKEFSIKTLEA